MHLPSSIHTTTTPHPHTHTHTRSRTSSTSYKKYIILKCMHAESARVCTNTTWWLDSITKTQRKRKNTLFFFLLHFSACTNTSPQSRLKTTTNLLRFFSLLLAALLIPYLCHLVFKCATLRYIYSIFLDVKYMHANDPISNNSHLQRTQISKMSDKRKSQK